MIIRRTELKDRDGHILAILKTDDKGNEEIYTARGFFLGRYRVINNMTSDAQGRFVGWGNLLTSLITDWRDGRRAK